MMLGCLVGQETNCRLQSGGREEIHAKMQINEQILHWLVVTITVNQYLLHGMQSWGIFNIMVIMRVLSDK